MTDAVATKKQIDNPAFNSLKLGDFKLEGNFDYVIMYSNGVYIAKKGDKKTLHIRGFPTLKPEDVLNAKGDSIEVKRIAPLKVKEAIIQNKIKDTGDFLSKDKKFSLESNRQKYGLDLSKLNFEYLNNNELQTDYFYNTALEQKYIKEPEQIAINVKDFAIKMYSKAPAIVIPKLEIDPNAIGLKIDQACTSKNRTRDLRRLINSSQKYALVRITEKGNFCIIEAFNTKFAFYTSL